MSEPFIHLAGVKKVYRTRGADFLAVSEVTFDVEAGELVSLVGPSGCGKTTLLKILAGLHSYEAGEVRPGSPTQPFDPSRDIGMVFQQPLLLKWRRIIDNVLLPYRISPVLTLDAEARERAKSLVQEVGLGDKQRRYPGYLSQGERQRIAVCRALVTRPAIILGDEPTGNLDPDNRDHIMDTLWRYCDETQAPLIVVTHNHDLLARFDRTVDVREFSG